MTQPTTQSTSLRAWWNSLDLYWKRVFKIILKPEFENNKASRDAYTPTDHELQELIGRQELAIKNASVSNLEPLVVFHSLSDLSIGGLSYLKSATTLSKLQSLKRLTLSGMPVSLLTFLQDLSDLERFHLSGSGIKDMTILEPLRGLKQLSISEPYLESLAGLVQPKLEELWLSVNMSGIDSLPVLPSLKKLTLTTSNIASIASLESQTSLVSLTLYHLPIRSLLGIENLTRLQSLSVDTCPVGDLSPLSNLINLTSLDIAHTNVKNLDPIYALKKLRSLSIKPGNFELEDMDRLMATFPQCRITKPPFSFRGGQHYNIIKAFQSGEQMFRKGMRLAFLESVHNHYDGVVNCTFTNVDTNEKMFWSFYDMEPEKCEQYFQLIRYPKA